MENVLGTNGISYDCAGRYLEGTATSNTFHSAKLLVSHNPFALPHSPSAGANFIPKWFAMIYSKQGVRLFISLLDPSQILRSDCFALSRVHLLFISVGRKSSRIWLIWKAPAWLGPKLVAADHSKATWRFVIWHHQGWLSWLDQMCSLCPCIIP